MTDRNVHPALPVCNAGIYFGSGVVVRIGKRAVRCWSGVASALTVA